jgi:nitroreductase
VLKLLGQRASIREFTTPLVPDHMLETVLLAALRAPTSFNFQPYTFVEIRDPQNRAELADTAQHQGLISEWSVRLSGSAW